MPEVETDTCEYSTFCHLCSFICLFLRWAGQIQGECTLDWEVNELCVAIMVKDCCTPCALSCYSTFLSAGWGCVVLHSTAFRTCFPKYTKSADFRTCQDRFVLQRRNYTWNTIFVVFRNDCPIDDISHIPSNKNCDRTCYHW